ncbi:MAG: hypothetical protein ACD_81C00034G0003 [uncultured bacterium]|uniref:PEGA domain-containing protein n=1 Tax=Candidatus Wolfebacteria bacterium GW2011_GWE2_44_13 TaxID=1619017 RepID=A0A0G1HAZ7_9BACT|nr:MAG: hypothetical protein ACD_81C00034G0003 [uncultured bacterium]KKT43683.1 MAG: hypothetical protein UW32_C0001G0275 [Candidatus Wolfebacteria bacterium GW2011_GWE2_44_13]
MLFCTTIKAIGARNEAIRQVREFEIMPHRTRLILFYTFVLIFLIAGTGVLLYSSGWRIDLETKTIQKIGAIYIKANVRDVTIKINDKLYEDEAGIIQSGTLISNLLPKIYRVEITKEGYQPYYKTLTVKPSVVEEILNAQLIPEVLEPTVIAPTKGMQFVDTHQAANKMILQDTRTGIYYLYDKANASSTTNLTMAVTNAQRGQKIRKIAFVPFKPTQFIIEDSAGFKLFDSEKKSIESLAKGSVVTWGMKDSTIISVQTTKEHRQEVSSLNLIFKTQTALDGLNKQIATTTYITAIGTTGSGGAIAFTDVKNGLFLFTPKTEVLTRIAEGVKSFTFSPDGKKLAIVQQNGTITIQFIEEFNGDIRKKEGDSISITLAQKELIHSIQWYADSYHLFVEYPNELFLTELDDRKPLNVFNVLTGFTDYRYIAENSSIYFTNEKYIHSIQIEK